MGNNEPLQFGGALGFDLTQSRQLMRGDRLPPGSLCLGPGSFRDVPHIGFEFGLGRLKHLRRLTLADQGKQRFVAPDLARETTVARRLPRLPLEALGLGIDLPQNIVEANEIVLRRLETQLGFVAAEWSGDASGFRIRRRPAAWRR